MDAVQRYVESFVNGLHEGGVRNAVICPGSRSTLLAVTLSRKEGIRVWVLYDERSSGFFALGMAKSSSAPVALVSTSGTAASNFLPAIVEAKLSRVPLVVVTADRPPELRDFGAPQTIDQIRIYGSHVKWFQDMPTAADLPSLLRYSLLVGARASYIAQSSPAGPVHVNFPFREPLLPENPLETQDKEVEHVSVTRFKGVPAKDDVESAVREIRDNSRGIIVVGPGENGELCDGLSGLAKSLGWPILADSLSNLRHDEPPYGLVRSYEFLLRNKAFRASNSPEWVIRLGGVPTSKELNTFCEGARTIILDDGGEWRDPSLSLSRMIYGDLKTSVSLISDTLKDFARPPDWLDVWLDRDSRALERTDSFMENIHEPFEGKLFHQLSMILNQFSPLTVIVGNSMPVRDLDAFFLKGAKGVHLVGNKGANGIDGLVSTAMGIAAMEGNVLLILGDVSFYHDMNGLLASRLHNLNATIVVVNNGGAGIFSFLPQHSLPSKLFESLFGEPHDLDFSGVKTIYGGEFHRVASWRAFGEALLASLPAKGLKIIEFLALDRESNLLMHRRAFQDISSSVGD
jgi:2-succinyl-5-enolpyruvyl-6-hydroxy-3-cyclohexene-1-carboxylate synthase